MSNTQEKKSSQSFLSLLQVGVFEVIFIVLLVAIILLTLNYFNLVPLSQTFSFLSFLPQQGQVQTKPFSRTERQTSPSQKAKTPTIRYLITPDDPQSFPNDSSVNKFNTIKGSEIKVLGKMKVNIEMSITEIASKTGSESSGLFFDNGLFSSERDYKYLRLFYYPPHNNWVMEYRHGGKSESFLVFSIPSGKIFGRFSINIEANGRSITITLPTGEQKTFQLPNSLYLATNQMRSIVQVAPHSAVTVSSLSYQY